MRRRKQDFGPLAGVLREALQRHTAEHERSVAAVSRPRSAVARVFACCRNSLGELGKVRITERVQIPAQLQRQVLYVTIAGVEVVVQVTTANDFVWGGPNQETTP